MKISPWYRVKIKEMKGGFQRRKQDTVLLLKLFHGFERIAAISEGLPQVVWPGNAELLQVRHYVLLV